MSEPRSGEAPPRLCDFPPAGRDAWERRALRELRGDPLTSLRRETADGIAVEALYVDGETGSPSHREALARPPGAAPFLRGAAAPGIGGWRIRQLVDATAPAAANADARDDLARGVDSLWIRLDERQMIGASADDEDLRTGVRSGVAVRDLDALDRLLDGVDLARGDLVLEVGAAAAPITAGVLTLAARRGISTSDLRLTIAADPLAALALGGRVAGGLGRAYDGLAAALRALEPAPAARGVLVSAIPYADAGASAGEEVALLLCALLEHLRRLEARGLAPAEVAPRLLAALTADRNIFSGIAKIRAARLLAARVLAACGVAPQAAALAIHVEGSWRELSGFDPWVNLLRGTVGAFVGAVAGVESVATPPFTDALGQADADARRIASNTQLLLREECHLDRVADPLGGSWYVESLTDALARAAWARVQAIEAAGGLAAALERGEVQARIAAQAGAQGAAVARAVAPITGVNRYAILDEGAPAAGERAVAAHVADAAPVDLAADAPFPAIQAALNAGASFAAVQAALAAGASPTEAPALVRGRLAAPFEELRREASDAGDRAALVCVGALAAIKPRIDFIRALLASGGIAAAAADVLHEGADAAADAFAGSPSEAAVIVAGDDAYPELVPALVPRLRAAGARTIALAGRPRDPAVVAALREAGVDLFLARGVDALAALTQLHASLASRGAQEAR
ncbi:MAG: methylmalonyl-CoA mutase family protein [Nannocystaceae bacterium]